jgi:actin related protein 2/3 complex, subunit 1A/1B
MHCVLPIVRHKIIFNFQVRLFSALIKDIEKAPEAHSWGGRSSLGALIAEFPAPGSSLGGWVHAVSFSADGNRVAWVAHDSSISVADPKRPCTRLKTQFLPFRAITWVAPDKLVAAGHDCSPYLYKVTPEGQLVLVCKLDVYKKREAGGLR